MAEKVILEKAVLFTIAEIKRLEKHLSNTKAVKLYLEIRTKFVIESKQKWIPLNKQFFIQSVGKYKYSQIKKYLLDNNLIKENYSYAN